MLNKFEVMRIFCQLVEAGSFSAAAERMGVSTSAISRQIAQLEAHLNVRLLHRTTRRMKPTEEGELYFERCTQLLSDLEETEANISGDAYYPRGRLRIAAPVVFAQTRLTAAFASFAQKYPDITLDIHLSDGLANFAEEGLDMAIRVGQIGSDTLIARELGKVAMCLVASPAYLKRAGTPKKTDDLVAHTCLNYSLSSLNMQWLLENAAGKQRTIPLSSTIWRNNGRMLADMAANDCGITYAPYFIVREMLASKQLVALLPEWSHRHLTIYVVYPSRRHLPAKVREMSKFLVEWFQQHAK